MEEKTDKSPGRKRYFKTVRSVRAYVGRVMLAMEEKHCPPGRKTSDIDTDAARCMGFLAKVMADIISKTALEERIEALERKAMKQANTQQAAAH